MFSVPERYRITTGIFQSTHADGNNGAFVISSEQINFPLHVIASDQMGWEHVSVSLPHRCPTWEEMSMIKGLFWDAGDCVIQIHPAIDDYVNNHPFCLHLWRKSGTNNFYQKPPNAMVGIPDKLINGILKK